MFHPMQNTSVLRATDTLLSRTTCSACCPLAFNRTAVGVDWQFNGWGDLYGTFEQDKLVARKICAVEKMPYVSVDMVLEGGSIHVDGEG